MHIKYMRMCLRLNEFPELSLFNIWDCVYFVSEYEVTKLCIINHCLGLGHKTMVHPTLCNVYISFHFAEFVNDLAICYNTLAMKKTLFTSSVLFTRGQFWPSGIVVACVCLCVCPCVCVNPQLVRVITHHPFKLGSPNLDHRCKRPWIRSLLFFCFFCFFLGGGDWLWPSRSNLTSKSKVTPFWACGHDNSSPVQTRTPNFGPKVQNTWVKIPINLGIDWSWSSISFSILKPFFLLNFFALFL